MATNAGFLQPCHQPVAIILPAPITWFRPLKNMDQPKVWQWEQHVFYVVTHFASCHWNRIIKFTFRTKVQNFNIILTKEGSNFLTKSSVKNSIFDRCNNLMIFNQVFKESLVQIVDEKWILMKNQQLLLLKVELFQVQMKHTKAHQP